MFFGRKLCLLLMAGAVAGCGKGPPQSAPADHVDSTPPFDAAAEARDDAGAPGPDGRERPAPDGSPPDGPGSTEARADRLDAMDAMDAMDAAIDSGAVDARVGPCLGAGAGCDQIAQIAPGIQHVCAVTTTGRVR